MISFHVLVLGAAQSPRQFTAPRLPYANEILVFPSSSPEGEMQQVISVAHLNFASTEQEPISVVVCRPPSIPSMGSEWTAFFQFIQSWPNDVNDWQNLN